jgi:hypothetical protein
VTNQQRRELRLKWRAAERYVAGYAPPIVPPIRFQRRILRLRFCEERGLLLGAAIARTQLTQLADRLVLDASPLRRLSEPNQTPPAVKDVFAELRAIEREFDGLVLKPSQISVITPPIELGGIELGRFEIQLIGKALKVVALEPHPAESDSDITHPHVSAGQLCAGWGAVPMAAALTEGRLLGFSHDRPASPADLQPRQPLCLTRRLVRAAVRRL